MKVVANRRNFFSVLLCFCLYFLLLCFVIIVTFRDTVFIKQLLKFLESH